MRISDWSSDVCSSDLPPDDAVAVEHRQRLARVMPEPGIRFLTFVRQRYPGLDAVHRTAVGPQLLEALGMGDTPARGHPVDLAGPDRLFGADAVALPDLAIEQGEVGRAPVYTPATNANL